MYKIISSLLLAGFALSFTACNSNESNQTPSDSSQKIDSSKTAENKSPEERVTIKSGPKETLKSKDGRKISVYEYEAFAKDYLEHKDEFTYVINFWATWCGPCVAELPHFLDLEKEMKDKKVKFVFVSFDDLKSLDKKVLPFLDDRKIDSEIVVLDQKGINDWLGKIDENWSGSIPATLVYSADRRDFFEEKFDSKAELITALALP